MSTPPNDDSDLRAMLDDAVSGVHPRRGTDEIRNPDRAGRPAAGRWLPVTLAAAVATVAVIGGAAWLGRQGDDPPAAGPSTPRTSQEASPESQASRTVTVPVYYVGETASGPRLFKETHRVPGTTKSELQVAVDEATSGRPQDPDYSSSWPYSDLVPKATQGEDEILIDFVMASGDTGGALDAGAEERAVQALVWTADAATGTDLPVRLTFNGGPISELFMTDAAVPAQRSSADSVLAPVSIEAPGESATVATRFEVTGQASTFEANVVWELRRGDTVVRHGFTTARECCMLSPYAFTVTAAPGDYTLVVHDTDESDGEGNGTSQDTKQVTVE